MPPTPSDLGTEGGKLNRPAWTQEAKVYQGVGKGLTRSTCLRIEVGVTI